MSDDDKRSRILVVVGMTREAKILDGPEALIGGGDAPALADRLEAELSQGAAGVISFGLCGALAPELKVGDLVIGEAAVDVETFQTDSAWSRRLAAAFPGAAHGRFAWARQPVASAKAKSEVRERTGAVAVDLESYVAGRFARKFAVPFAIVRAVSDAADRALPHAAQVGLGGDGRPAIGAVLASLRDNPWQIGGLVRTALEAEDGFHALERARQALGPRLAGPAAA